MSRHSNAAMYFALVALNTQRFRVRRGYTQARLAELANLDVRYLQRIERARVNPTISVIVRLADALGVSPSELLGDGAAP